MSIQFRRAVLGDLDVMHAIRRDAILGIETRDTNGRQAWADRRSAAYYAERVTNGEVLVAHLAGDDVAWGSSTGDRVTALYVCSSNSELGVGRALMSELESAVVARGHAYARLESSPNAVGFYERLGYTRVGVPQADGALPMSKRMGSALE